MQAAKKFVPVVTVNGREQVGEATSWAAASEYAEYAKRAGFLATVREHRPQGDRRFANKVHTAFAPLL